MLISTSSGLNTPHKPNEKIDAHLAENNYVFMLFKTPFTAKTENNKNTGKAGDMLINGNGFPHWHKGIDEDIFINDWIRITGDDIHQIAKKYHFPINIIFKPIKNDFFTQSIREIQNEITVKDHHWRDRVHQLILNLFQLCSRHYLNHKEMKAKVSPGEAAHYETLQNIRMELHEKYQMDWSVKTLAAKAHLSPSRFSSLYKKFFKTAVHKDLLNVRIMQARWLLSNRNNSIGETAITCGFQDINYFSRYFKKSVGISPSQFQEQEC